MSTTPEPEAASQDGAAETEAPTPAPTPTPASAPPVRPAPRGAAALIFDDPLSRQSSDDTDRGWGERPASADSAADLARFLDEKPPHHL
ncbi:hypothetical protein GCM10010211_60350 [Streptomyces albospinus]|uniref:Uncharacterized protein n=1 Tax=Streptomyces albospinus TaxID=285515 RepID=A0ABQ2VJ32_9ACTN|nr:hypothetical protein [Streptomyces albospinus]GGU86147.1 hypothetical protein GCM10010211_60350 [Streptomyces albospinus]